MKKGENGHFYEGSMVCQEMPILTFRNQVQSKAIKGLNKFSSVTGKLIKAGVNVFINAINARYIIMTVNSYIPVLCIKDCASAIYITP